MYTPLRTYTYAGARKNVYGAARSQGGRKSRPRESIALYTGTPAAAAAGATRAWALFFWRASIAAGARIDFTRASSTSYNFRDAHARYCGCGTAVVL